MTDRYYRNTGGRRPPTRRGQNRKEVSSDVISTALTAQILICIILIIALLVIKKLNEERYIEIKNTYTTMSTDVTQNARLAELISSWSSGKSVGETINNAIGYLGSVINAKDNINAVEETSRSSSSQEVALASQPPQTSSEAEDQFGYNYLPESEDVSQQDVSQQDVSQQDAMGGMMPINISGDNGQYEAPPGSALSPIMLAGVIKPPISGKITSRFAYRLHPITEKADFHTGIDIAAEEGRAILAALPGEVVEVGESDVYGKYIIMQHATNLQTFYGHCSEIIAKEGMAVRQGERIAKVGQTGIATGPHLHFSVIVEGLFTDPIYILGDYIQVVE